MSDALLIRPTHLQTLIKKDLITLVSLDYLN